MRFTGSESGGALDVLITSGVSALAGGPLMEAELRGPSGASRAPGAVHFGASPKPSFGHLLGQSVPGSAELFEALFTDGFETGDTLSGR